MQIFTIGYEGVSLDEFLERLRDARVKCLVDVREAPISRKKGFSKSALAAALEQAGLGYMHLRALGCPKPIRDRHREDGDWDLYTQAYMAHLAEQRPALEQLATQAAQQSSALMCYEADFNRCHRTYVAREVGLATGLPVIHLTREGGVPDAAVPRIG